MHNRVSVRISPRMIRIENVEFDPVLLGWKANDYPVEPWGHAAKGEQDVARGRYHTIITVYFAPIQGTDGDWHSNLVAGELEPHGHSLVRLDDQLTDKSGLADEMFFHTSAIVRDQRQGRSGRRRNGRRNQDRRALERQKANAGQKRQLQGTRERFHGHGIYRKLSQAGKKFFPFTTIVEPASQTGVARDSAR